jgi:hypothetical protein
MFRSSRFFACSSLLCLALLSAAVPRLRADTAELVLSSQPGDFIGAGQTKDIIYTPSNSNFFSASVSDVIAGLPSYLSFAMGTVTSSNATNTFSTLAFATNQLGIAFQPGVYGLPGNTAQRAPFASPGHAGLDVTFQNRGSNTLTGNFTVSSVQFFKDTSNNFQLGELDVTFEQHSEGARPALFGHFTYLATGFNLPTVPDNGGSMLLLGLGVAALFVVSRRIGAAAYQKR